MDGANGTVSVPAIGRPALVMAGQPDMLTFRAGASDTRYLAGGGGRVMQAPGDVPKTASATDQNLYIYGYDPAPYYINDMNPTGGQYRIWKRENLGKFDIRHSYNLLSENWLPVNKTDNDWTPPASDLVTVALLDRTLSTQIPTWIRSSKNRNIGYVLFNEWFRSSDRQECFRKLGTNFKQCSCAPNPPATEPQPWPPPPAGYDCYRDPYTNDECAQVPSPDEFPLRGPAERGKSNHEHGKAVDINAPGLVAGDVSNPRVRAASDAGIKWLGQWLTNEIHHFYIGIERAELATEAERIQAGNNRIGQIASAQIEYSKIYHKYYYGPMINIEHYQAPPNNEFRMSVCPKP